ncbi:hypothetical protein BDY21DRAFT_119885 [Lineolata rhizophorae]|uniref:Hsp70 protein-domain-containing protein n=1 Tax=Lineolata rhizophorae TaxID=578093 RepID=A0A6A6NQG9_9PEZI|nr:hypothetical protein BDY21DRAFT_119885 [Lineolata rhizophorae]
MPNRVFVGVDIGLTYTGVSYSTLDQDAGPNPQAPATITQWPGLDGFSKKVPTRVCYRAGRYGIRSWGFECPSTFTEAQKQYCVYDCFKLWLEKSQLDIANERLSSQGEEEITLRDVEMWFEDFLVALYEHAKAHIFKALKLVDWDSCEVEFVFGIPVTWRGKDVVKTFRCLVESTGFGKSPNHNVEIDLDEAEAAAVYAAFDPKFNAKALVNENLPVELKSGSILLVCDAGDCATDISILEVSSDERSPSLSLIPKAVSSGKSIGSALIAQEFERLLEKRLQRIRDKHPDMFLPKSSARTILRTQFEKIKTGVGKEDFDSVFSLPKLALQCDHLPKDFNCAEVEVERGRLKINIKDHVLPLFNAQANHVVAFIDEQFKQLQKNMPDAKVLSDGFSHTSLYRETLGLPNTSK